MKTAPGAPTETSAFAYFTNLISTFTVAGSPAKTFVLDAKKNTLGNGRGVFAYDLKNNLIQATVNGVVSSYAFDALNQRVSKTVGGVVTRFIYDEAGNLAGEYDGAGALKAEHIYLGALPVGVRMNGSTYRVHTDYLGTPRAATLGSTIVWKWPSSDPFGGNAPSVAAIVYNPRFPGQYFDAESGLHHNKHRAYDPVLGRYLQPDPLGLAAGKNPFNYVNQNPLNATDREGLSADDHFEIYHIIRNGRVEHVGMRIGKDLYEVNPGYADVRFRAHIPLITLPSSVSFFEIGYAVYYTKSNPHSFFSYYKGKDAQFQSAKFKSSALKNKKMISYLTALSAKESQVWYGYGRGADPSDVICTTALSGALEAAGMPRVEGAIPSSFFKNLMSMPFYESAILRYTPPSPVEEWEVVAPYKDDL